MGNKEIKSGDKFGRLTVLNKDESRKNNKNSYYICLCICGEMKSKMRGNLLSGSTLSCGCLRTERATNLNKNHTKEESGNRYGKLFVIGRDLEAESEGVRWLCRCDCGKELSVEGYCLRNGNSTSCGCKRSETLRALPSKAIDEVGNRYGRLVVLRRGENDGNLAQWWCLCECGNEILRNGSRLRSGSIQSCGCLEELNRLNNCSISRLKHGLSEHPLYRKFHSIKARCYRASAPDYFRYGGRGIKICDEWLKRCASFIEWAIANGWVENAKLSVDRIDNDGHYSPENCRIVGFSENTVKRFTDRGQGLFIDGVPVNIRDRVRKSNISPSTVKKLSIAGYSERDIVDYGKLTHYQKIAIGKSIKNGSSLTISAVNDIKRKFKVYAKAPGYTNYTGMLGRCNNPSNRAYHRYGGRGIKVCVEWNNFESFLLDMGAPPYPDAAIHRIDENGDYSSSNCVWVSRSENTKAMHRAKKIRNIRAINGEPESLHKL